VAQSSTSRPPGPVPIPAEALVPARSPMTNLATASLSPANLALYG
jgi:hypothetical protein